MTDSWVLGLLRNAVAAAIQAPSAQNTQPWRFKIEGSSLELYADQSRHLRVLDAERRQQLQSCGCALYNARVAVRAAGFVDEVTVWLADRGHPDHLATLHVGERREVDEADRALLAAIPRRKTNRRGFLPRPVSWEISEDLRAAAAAEGAHAVRLTPAAKRALGELVARADQLQYDDPAFRAELSSWLISYGSRRRDGIPFVEKEYGSALPFSVMRALRSPWLGAELASIEQDHLLGAPVVLALGTASDDPSDWFACGQALQAVLLAATVHDLSASFLNQVLEIPALRELVAELVPEIGRPQMILRIGVASEPVHRAAPRRDLDDVIDE